MVVVGPVVLVAALGGGVVEDLQVVGAMQGSQRAVDSLLLWH